MATPRWRAPINRAWVWVSANSYMVMSIVWWAEAINWSVDR